MTKKHLPFQFKLFLIHHDLCAMKVGVDGVLTGAWANQESPKKILDIGTGSGLIALMLQQRFPKASISAIEPNELAYQQAKKNFSINQLGHDIFLEKISLQNYSTANKYDLIVTNPPFYAESVNSGDSNRDQARQAKFLPVDDLFSLSKKILDSNGNLQMIYPTSNIREVIKSAEKNGFYLNQKVEIIPSISKPSKRTLLSFSLIQKTFLDSTLTIENSRNNYTEEYISLTREFYLNF